MFHLFIIRTCHKSKHSLKSKESFEVEHFIMSFYTTCLYIQNTLETTKWTRKYRIVPINNLTITLTLIKFRQRSINMFNIIIMNVEIRNEHRKLWYIEQEDDFSINVSTTLFCLKFKIISDNSSWMIEQVMFGLQ